MKTTLIAVLFAGLSTICHAQDAYKGLTPGVSTRYQVERVFGTPVNTLSSTLFEYFGTPDVSKIYVQYAETTPPVALRIELLCDMQPTVRRGCFALVGKGDLLDIWIEAKADARIQTRPEESSSSSVTYYGSPDYVVSSRVEKAGKEQYRIGFYSKALYEAALPKGGCTGLWTGIWDTNRGRMVLTSTNDPEENGNSYEFKVKGSFSTTGTVTGVFSAGIIWLTGEWKDETGAGTMELDIQGLDETRQNSFKGKWKRTSGKGTREGTWEGRCVDTETFRK